VPPFLSWCARQGALLVLILLSCLLACLLKNVPFAFVFKKNQQGAFHSNLALRARINELSGLPHVRGAFSWFQGCPIGT